MEAALGVAANQGDLSSANSAAAPTVASSSSAGLPLMVGAEPPTLVLSPVMASQLVQMFGPAGTGIIVVVDCSML